MYTLEFPSLALYLARPLFPYKIKNAKQEMNMNFYWRIVFIVPLSYISILLHGNRKKKKPSTFRLNDNLSCNVKFPYTIARQGQTDSSCMLFLSRIDTCVIASLYSEVYYYIPRQTGLKKFDSFDFYILTFLLLIKSAIIQQLNNDFILYIILRRIKYNSGNVWIFVWITLSMAHD